MSKIINRKARHDYDILDTYIAGISLKGSEVKAIRNGSMSLKEAFITIKNGEVFLKNANISIPINAFEKINEKRDRKLLLNKSEIRKLQKETEKKGYTIIPLEVFRKNNFYKVKIGLAIGLKKYDKRQKLKEKDQKREMEKNFKYGGKI